MRYLGYGWRMLVGLVELAVVWALLNATHTTFEKTVVAGLIVLYASIVGSFMLQQRAQLELATRQWQFFISLGKLLNHPDADTYSAAIKGQIEQTQKKDIGFWISIVFNWLTAVIALLALLFTALYA